MPLPSILHNVRGLGSAHHGFSDWWVQRVTAAGLAPLGVWFVISLLVFLHAPSAEIAHWLGRPWNTVLMLALLLLLFQHLYLGLRVIIEDYLRDDGTRLVVATLIKAGVLLLWLAASVSVLRVAFVG